VFFGGTASDTMVSSGGIALVESGGSASLTVVGSGGYLVVLPGGSQTAATGTIVSAGVVRVQPGSGVTIYGPVARDVVVDSGATECVLSGGTASFTMVSSGGDDAVYAGGTATGTVVSSGGYEVVSSGGVAIGTTVSNGGYEVVSSGGAAISTTVNSDGRQAVSYSGATTGTTVSSGGYEVVSYAGTTSFTTVSSGGYEVVSYGGSAISTTVDSDGEEVVSYRGTASGTTVNAGYQLVSGGTASATTMNGGTQRIFSGGSAVSTTLNSIGYQAVLPGATASFTTVNSGGTQFVFSGGTAIDTTLNVGGTIELVYPEARSGSDLSGTVSASASGLLTVSLGGQTYALQLSGDYTDEHFVMSADQYDGRYATRVAAEAGAAPCYRSGTRILTDRGEVAVEALRVGDRVQTVLGGTAPPIIWIGRREVDCARHPKPRKVWPVRVAAGAFGPGLPHSDLWLSPNHAVYVNEVLIPVKHLINGSAITQVPMDRVTYHHIELAAHDVLLAEGLPAESFLDMRDGSNYANRPGPVRLYPDYAARMWEAFGCARLIVTGPELAATRAVVARFATTQAAA